MRNTADCQLHHETIEHDRPRCSLGSSLDVVQEAGGRRQDAKGACGFSSCFLKWKGTGKVGSQGLSGGTTGS
jgi:hypothetical protein